MDTWVHITQFLGSLFSWPPGWGTVLFALVTGAVVANARLALREFAALAALAALFYFPLLYLGPAISFVAFKGGTATFHLFGFQPGVPQGLVEAGSFVLATFAVIAWKQRFAPVATDPVEESRIAELRQSQWQLLYGLSRIALAPLSLMVHFATIFGTGAGVPAMVLTMFTPVLAQVYWVVAIFIDTGRLDHPVTKLFALWCCVFALFMLARWKSGAGRSAAPAAARTPPPRPVWPQRPSAKGC
jgi:hypothetical protein